MALKRPTHPETLICNLETHEYAYATAIGQLSLDFEYDPELNETFKRLLSESGEIIAETSVQGRVAMDERTARGNLAAMLTNAACVAARCSDDEAG